MDNDFDLVGNIIAYEDGELEGEKLVLLFSHLIKGNLLNSLQGRYGRMATLLIQAKVLDEEGNING